MAECADGQWHVCRLAWDWWVMVLLVRWWIWSMQRAVILIVALFRWIVVNWLALPCLTKHARRPYAFPIHRLQIHRHHGLLKSAGLAVVFSSSRRRCAGLLGVSTGRCDAMYISQLPHARRPTHYCTSPSPALLLLMGVSQFASCTSLASARVPVGQA